MFDILRLDGIVVWGKKTGVCEIYQLWLPKICRLALTFDNYCWLFQAAILGQKIGESHVVHSSLNTQNLNAQTKRLVSINVSHWRHICMIHLLCPFCYLASFLSEHWGVSGKINKYTGGRIKSPIICTTNVAIFGFARCFSSIFSGVICPILSQIFSLFF